MDTRKRASGGKEGTSCEAGSDGGALDGDGLFAEGAVPGRYSEMNARSVVSVERVCVKKELVTCLRMSAVSGRPRGPLERMWREGSARRARHQSWFVRSDWWVVWGGVLAYCDSVCCEVGLGFGFMAGGGEVEWVGRCCVVDQSNA